MLDNFIDSIIEENKKRYNEWLSDSYEMVKNEFGKKVCYRGVDYIVVGLDIKRDTDEISSFNNFNSYTTKEEIVLVLKSSFIDTIEISLSEYWKRYENSI